MDEECNEATIIPILPTCCFICNSSDATTDVNNAIIETTGSSLCDLVQLLVPACRDELQLLPTICPDCTALVSEYDDLRDKQRHIEQYARGQYSASQAARASLDVVIELGDNRVSVPYGVYREHRAATAEQPLPAESPTLEAPLPAEQEQPEQSPAVIHAADIADVEPLIQPSPPSPHPTPPKHQQQQHSEQHEPQEEELHQRQQQEAGEAETEERPTSLDVEIHVEGSGRLCHVCDARFPLMAELASHLRDAHHLSGSEIRAVRTRSAAVVTEVPARPVSCPLCEDREFASAERARAHLLQRHRPQLEAGVRLPPELTMHLCGQCGAVFRRADMCRKHEATHRALASAHRCEMCGKSMRYRHGLKRHLQSQHGLSADHPAVERAAAPAARHPCDRCPRVFADYDKYLFHCRAEHLDEPDVGFGCELCGRRFEKRSELRLHRDAHQETSYSCVTCEKHFRTRLAYQKHMKLHDGGGWRCEHCAKTFDTRSNLATHLQTHSSRRQHVCGECGAAFKFGQTLARHRTVRHGGDTPRFVCDVCGKAFPLEHSLNLHRSRHGPATLQCPHCPAKFANRPDLQRHVRRIHSGAAAEPVPAAVPAAPDPLQTALLALADDTGEVDDPGVGVTFDVTL